MVRSVAWQISQRLPRSAEVDELIGEGQLGLLRAARDYDPNKGAQFSTYAYWRVRGAMLDWVRRQDWFSSADLHAGLLASGPPVGAATVEPGTVSRSADVEDQEAADPAQAVSDNELRDIVRGLVGSLTGRSRQILEATLLNGQTLEQAGRAAGVHKGTAQRAQVRAFDELATALRDKGLSDLGGPALRQAVLKAAPQRRARPT
jgi:RNA polymerase sigma factor for flagellar operon FliA